MTDINEMTKKEQSLKELMVKVLNEPLIPVTDSIKELHDINLAIKDGIGEVVDNINYNFCVVEEIVKRVKDIKSESDGISFIVKKVENSFDEKFVIYSKNHEEMLDFFRGEFDKTNDKVADFKDKIVYFESKFVELDAAFSVGVSEVNFNIFSLKDSFESEISSLKGSFESEVSSLKGGFESEVSSFKGFFENKFSSMVNEFNQQISDLDSRLKEGENNIIENINDRFSIVSDSFESTKEKVSLLPYFVFVNMFLTIICGVFLFLIFMK